MSSKRGQVLILVTLALPVIFGLLAMVVDVGFAYFERQQAQAVADSAVLAAVSNMRDNGACSGFPCHECVTHNYTCPVSPGQENSLDIGCLYGHKNGPDFTITMSSGDGRTQGVNTLGWVSATASVPAPIFFGRWFQKTALQPTAHATGAVVLNADYICEATLIE